MSPHVVWMSPKQTAVHALCWCEGALWKWKQEADWLLQCWWIAPGVCWWQAVLSPAPSACQAHLGVSVDVCKLLSNDWEGVSLPRRVCYCLWMLFSPRSSYCWRHPPRWLCPSIGGTTQLSLCPTLPHPTCRAQPPWQQPCSSPCWLQTSHIAVSTTQALLVPPSPSLVPLPCMCCMPLCVPPGDSSLTHGAQGVSSLCFIMVTWGGSCMLCQQAELHDCFTQPAACLYCTHGH